MFVGKYKGVTIRIENGNFIWLKGWIPTKAQSLRAAKYQITRWQNVSKFLLEQTGE